MDTWPHPRPHGDPAAPAQSGPRGLVHHQQPGTEPPGAHAAGGTSHTPQQSPRGLRALQGPAGLGFAERRPPYLAGPWGRRDDSDQDPALPSGLHVWGGGRWGETSQGQRKRKEQSGQRTGGGGRITLDRVTPESPRGGYDLYQLNLASAL